MKRNYSQKNGIFPRLIFMVACIFRGLTCNFDIVEGTNFITYLPAFILGKLKHKKIIFWYADCWVGEWIKNIGGTGFFCELLERLTLLLGRNVLFIAISENTKNKLIKQGINPNRIKVIPCGVDRGEILGVESQNKIYDLVAVNRLVKYKNTEMIVNVAAGKNLSLLIIGDGEEQQNIENIIIRNHAIDKIKIIAKIASHKNLLATMAQAKIFISASQVEGFDIAAVEAAAMGLPCVLSDIPAHRELAKNLPGILIFRNEKELELMIKNIRHNEKYYHELSEANSKNAHKYYWRDIIKATEKVYEQDEK